MLFEGEGGGLDVLNAGPAVGAFDQGNQRVQRGAVALGFQRDAAVPVVGDPAGQPQVQCGGAGVLAKAHSLHRAGEPPAAAKGAHASMPVTV